MPKLTIRVCFSLIFALPLLALALPFAYVPDTANSSITVVDVATQTASGNITPGGQPIALELLPNGRSLYVANQGLTSLARYDLSYNTAPTGSPTATISTTSAPLALAASPDSKYLWISRQGTTAIIRMTVSDNSFNTPLDIGFAPGPLVINEAGTRLYIAENGGTRVAQIDISSETPTKLATWTLSGNASALALNSDGSRLFASITASNSINVRSTSAGDTEIGPISGASGVKGLLVSGTTLYAGTENGIMAWGSTDLIALPALASTFTATWLGTNQDRSTLYSADNAGNWGQVATGITPDSVYPVSGRFIGPYQSVFKFSAPLAVSANSFVSVVGDIPTFTELENIGLTTTIKVIRLGDTTGAASVSYNTASFGISTNYAQPGNDYIEASGTLTFAAGESEKFIAVQMIDDSYYGNTEYLHLLLSQATGYSQLGNVSENQAQLGISNDDKDPRDRTGCSLSSSKGLTDPTLWILVIFSSVALLVRRMKSGSKN